MHPIAPGRLALARLLNRLALAATEVESADEVLRIALEQVCAFTGWPVGHAYLLDEASGELVPSTVWHLADPGRFEALHQVTMDHRLPPGVGLPGSVLETGRARWVPDIDLEPGFPRAQPAADLGVKAAFAFPVRTRQGILAVLEFFAERPVAPDEEILATMATVGSQLGRVFERTLADERMREREARFRTVAENAAEAIVTIDEHDRIIFANRASERIFGYTAEELDALPFTSLMPERFRERHRRGMRRHVLTGERRIRWDGVELPGLHRDGREVPLEVTFGMFVRDGRHFFTGIMRDITDRKREEEERTRLLEREREARQAAEAARLLAERRAEEEAALREAAAAVSSAFTVEETVRRIAESALTATRADGAYVERLDEEAEEVVVVAVAGERAPALGLRGPRRGSLTERVIASERPELLAPEDGSAEGFPPHLAAACGDCRAALIPLLDAAEPVGALVLLRSPDRPDFRPDEVERAFTFGQLAALAFRKIRLLEDSERRREELERVMESRSHLMRGFSHDVKNPLGSADGFLQLLEDGLLGEVPEGQRETLVRARRSLRSALDLIEDLLELARAEAGQLEIRAAATDVCEAAREIAEEYRAAAERSELELRVALPAEPRLIESDPSRIRQVVGNLLSNAVKYTPPGGRVEVRVTAEEPGGRDGRVLVSVRDTGPGIAGEQRELLFEEFTRFGPGETEGAGIGLAISRRIARALGGDIVVESEPGQGSTFTLWLPLVPPGAG